MICLTAVLVLGMMSLVFFRSQSIIEPDAAVLVAGDPSFDGARVVVLSSHREVAAATLSEQNNFIAHILLQPGLYELEVDLHGRVLLADQFHVQSFQYATFALPTAIIVEGDASMAGAHVQITGNGERSTAADLADDNNYTAIGYHLPGTYELTVTRYGRIINDQMLTLVAHQPRRISLTRGNAAGFSK